MALSFVAEAENHSGADAGTDSPSRQPHPTPGLWPSLILFFVAAIGFACYRHDLCFVWDDSASMTGSLARSRWMRELHKSETPPSPMTTTGHILEEVFGRVAGNGYRPMAALFSHLSYWLLVDSDAPSMLHLLLAGAGYGGLAVCVFRLACRFVHHAATALFATFLVLASPPLVATSWVVLTGVQALVPMLIAMALLCYFKLREPGRHWPARVTLIAILFLGPWFREFLGIVPLLIGSLELIRARRPTLWMAAATLSLLHAIYPTALLKLICFPDLPLKPVFAMGNLASSLGAAEIRWHAPWYFLPLFPPTLLALAVLSALLTTLRNGWHALTSSEGRAAQNLASAVLYFVWLTSVVALMIFSREAACLGLLLCLGLVVIGIQDDLMLPVWFLACFLPMLRVFTEHIHFLYAMTPAAIILARQAEKLWEMLGGQFNIGWHALRYSEGRANGEPHALRSTSGRATPARTARHALAAVLALIAIDQAMNLVGAYKVNRAVYGGIQDVADWFVGNVPEGALVVSNVIHGEEVKWHSKDYFQNYWCVEAGVCDPSRVVDDLAKLERLLAGRGERPVYFLDVDFDYMPGKIEYHRHRFVHKWDVPREFVGLVHRTQTRYLFADPLRHLLPREFTPFLGAPDLVNDFYLGLPHHRWPFRYEVYAEYRVYLVAPSALASIKTLDTPRP
jgi:hypothetical protein